MAYIFTNFLTTIPFPLRKLTKKRKKMKQDIF